MKEKFVGLMLTLSFSGCTQLPSSLENESRWEARRQALELLENWTLDGRIAIHRGEEGWHVSLHWEQQGSTYRMQISGPAGQGAARIEGNSSSVLLTQGNGQVVRAYQPEELLARVIEGGEQIPVTALRRWVIGLPSPNTETQTLDPEGHLASLRQEGWNVGFERYTAVGTLDLPKRIVLERPTITIKLVVDYWGVPNQTLITSRSASLN
ncbi:Outer-membrane lipoprotein LolB [Gammaproteobacteria bacterium]